MSLLTTGLFALGDLSLYLARLGSTNRYDWCKCTHHQPSLDLCSNPTCWCTICFPVFLHSWTCGDMTSRSGDHPVIWLGNSGLFLSWDCARRWKRCCQFNKGGNKLIIFTSLAWRTGAVFCWCVRHWPSVCNVGKVHSTRRVYFAIYSSTWRLLISAFSRFFSSLTPLILRP